MGDHKGRPYCEKFTMKIKNLLYLALAFIMINQSCITIDTSFEGLPPGQWRAVLKLDNRPKISNKKGIEFTEKYSSELFSTSPWLFLRKKEYELYDKLMVDSLKLGPESIAETFTGIQSSAESNMNLHRT